MEFKANELAIHKTGNVILTSDDFGLSKIYNHEILVAIQSNLLSSVSVMVDRYMVSQRTQFDQLLDLSKERNVSLGLHLELPEKKIDNVTALCEAQWTKFESLLNGIKPHYIDIHKHHLFVAHFDEIAQYCLKKNVAFRRYPQTTVSCFSPDDMFMVYSSTSETMISKLLEMKEGSSLELVFHLGAYDDSVKSSLNRERVEDGIKLDTAFQLVTSQKKMIISYKDLIS
ncbi:MAG: ChbG/HpnK family deacetylase [Pedobacter sp.]|nr:MAG: ChbG/HpnK family deacetylase [Pedobacter sp.]